MDTKKTIMKRVNNIVGINETINNTTWKAILIDSYCQAGKTKKCFEILNDKMQKIKGNQLVLFVTQANSCTSAIQTIQRAKNSSLINNIIPINNITRSADVSTDGIVNDNYMIVDFWNSRNMNNMLDFVCETRDTFSIITIVIDECEQGYIKGIKERLSFIRQVEKIAHQSSIKVIFVTATIGNLSKSILRIAKDNVAKFKSGIVSDIIYKSVVEHHFAEPHDSYVFASWFNETPDVWNKLIFPKKTSEMSKQDYIQEKEITIMKAIKALPDSAKELTLIVTSTRTDDHKNIAKRLYRSGYNVTVELNGTNNKNFKVKYVNDSGGISSWNIPYSYIDLKADNGDLKSFRNSEKKLVKSGITCKEDYSLSHILQAALFMMTDNEKRIKENVSVDEFKRLEAISNAIANLDISLRRPDDYPEIPRIALIAGHLAGRGITIQNPFIDFTCTSFCFTDTRDLMQRGATNTQRFGRACGMLMDTFARSGRKPILIATEGIMRDALANETALKEKAESIKNGSLISLKDLITKEEWDRVIKATKDKLKETQDKVKNKSDPNDKLIDGVSPTALKHYFTSKNLLVGKMIRFLYQANKSVSFDEFKQGIKYEKNDAQFESNLKNGMSIKSCYGKLWTYETGIIELNPNIRDYL